MAKVKVGDVVLIEAVVEEVGEFDGKPTAFVLFNNSGGATIYQADLEVIETECGDEE